MTKHKNINDRPVVSPEGVKFVGVKDGKFVQCDLSSFMKKVNEEYPAAVNTSISKLDEAQNKAIAAVNSRIDAATKEHQSTHSAIEAMKLEIASLKETVAKLQKALESTPATTEVAEEEAKKATKTKKATKAAE